MATAFHSTSFVHKMGYFTAVHIFIFLIIIALVPGSTQRQCGCQFYFPTTKTDFYLFVFNLLLALSFIWLQGKPAATPALNSFVCSENI